MLFFILFRYPLIIFDDAEYVKQKVSYKTFLIIDIFLRKYFSSLSLTYIDYCVLCIATPSAPSRRWCAASTTRRTTCSRPRCCPPGATSPSSCWSWSPSPPTHSSTSCPTRTTAGGHHDDSSASNPSLYLEPTLTPCAAAGGPGGWPLPTLRVHPATANIQTPSNTASITWELEENIVKLSLCFFQYVAIMSVLNLCN